MPLEARYDYHDHYKHRKNPEIPLPAGEKSNQRAFIPSLIHCRTGFLKIVLAKSYRNEGKRPNKRRY